MDFNLIKKILEKEKAKIVIFEDGKPTMIISPIEGYLKEGNPTEIQDAPQSDQQKLGFREASAENLSEEKKGLTIDDLPL